VLSNAGFNLHRPTLAASRSLARASLPVANANAFPASSYGRNHRIRYWSDRNRRNRYWSDRNHRNRYWSNVGQIPYGGPLLGRRQ